MQATAVEEKILDSVSFNRMLRDYVNARKRLILLGYDGAILPFADFPAAAKPGRYVIEILEKLATNSLNDVCIITGRDQRTLEQWMGYLPLTLIAEHGARVRYKASEWEAAAMEDPTEWMPETLAIMEQYVASSPGSFIEKKEHSIAWHYRHVEADILYGTAKGMEEALRDAIERFSLHLFKGNKVIEVSRKYINKKTAVEKLFGREKYDFILYIGSDPTDEDMFRQLRYLPFSYTIKVGNDYSFAKYKMHHPYMVQFVLDTISRNNQR